MHIGPFALPNRLFVAPMAGVTDRPFRQLCRQLGAGYAVSEMVTSRKRPVEHAQDLAPRRPRRRARADRGADRRHRRRPMMAEAARYNIDRGAQIIDINMGCPAKKVCNKWAGSALMQDEPLALASCRPWCRLRAARRAGDAEDAHRLVPERAQCAALARAAEAPAWPCSPCTAARASRATRARPNTTPSPR
jgi:hypothetical protein